MTIWRASVTLYLDVDGFGEASDAVAETLREHMRDRAPTSCFLDWQHNAGLRPATDGELHELRESLEEEGRGDVLDLPAVDRSAPSLGTPETAEDIIRDLLAWEEHTGGWEADIWKRARQFIKRDRSDEIARMVACGYTRSAAEYELRMGLPKR